MKLINISICALLVLSLNGCGTSGSHPSSLSSDLYKAESALARMVGDARVGDQLQFNNTSVFGTDTIVVGDEYSAASGRLCRKLLNQSGEDLNRSVCQKRKNKWYVASALTGAPILGKKTERASKDIDMVSIDKSAPRFKIEDGETLWSFSARTTGNPRNWEKIARYNSIENVNDIDAGTSLAIPPGLSSPDS